MNRPQNQASLVRDDLRRRILATELLPGSRLVISDLCAEHGVSLGAVREALSGLEGEGLVVSHAKRGFQVAGMSLKELQDLTTARIEVEGACLRLALALGTLDWEASVVAALHKLNATERLRLNTNQLSEGWSSAHRAFHAALVAGCENGPLLEFRATLFEKSERYRRLSVPVEPKDRDVAAEHAALAEAALARDGDRITHLIRNHFSLTASIVIEAARPKLELTPSS